MPKENLRAAGDRIDALLDELEGSDPRSSELATEALALVSDLYGAGLERIMDLASESCPSLIESIVDDDLLASLLVVHGLHPSSLAHRVERAVESVRPLLGTHGGDLEILEVNDEEGAVRLRLLGSCDGCPSSSVTLELAVQRAITEAAPEIVRFEIDGATRPETAPVPVHMGPTPAPAYETPAYEHCPSELAGP